LAININKDISEWLRIAKLNNFDPTHEYKFRNSFEEIQDDLSLNSIFKTVVVDKKGIILNAHANLFSTNFESELLGYLNK
ncbi:MAG: hypothetical protein V7767_10170, partial [Leeuwenhoekiella sp.]